MLLKIWQACFLWGGLEMCSLGDTDPLIIKLLLVPKSTLLCCALWAGARTADYLSAGLRASCWVLPIGGTRGSLKEWREVYLFLSKWPPERLFICTVASGSFPSFPPTLQIRLIVPLRYSSRQCLCLERFGFYQAPENQHQPSSMFA